MAQLWQKIKTKLESEAPRYREEDWQKMAGLLDREPRLASRGFLSAGLGLGALVLSFGLTLAYLLWPAQGDEEVVISPAAKPSFLNAPPKQKETAKSEMSISEEPGTSEVANKAQQSVLQNEDAAPVAVDKSTAQVKPANRANNKEFNIASPAQPEKAAEATLAHEALARETEVAREQNDPAPAKANSDEKGLVVNPANLPLATAEKASQEKMSQPERETRAANEFDLAENATANLEPVVGDSAKRGETSERRVPNASADSLAKLASDPTQATSAPEEGAGAIIPRSTGFKLHGLTLINDLAYAADFWGFQSGLDLAWRRDNWSLESGLRYGQIQRLDEVTNLRLSQRIDSTLNTTITSRVEDRVRYIWVIDTFFSGRYVPDTFQVTVVDTLQNLRVDTLSIESIERENRTTSYQYFSLPIRVQYHWRWSNSELMLGSGLMLHQLTSYRLSEGQQRNDFGLDLLLEPRYRWQFSERWFLQTGVGLRYNLIENQALRQKPWRVNLSLGLGYRF